MRANIKKLPGFRSGKKWKSVVSIIVFYWPTLALLLTTLWVIFSKNLETGGELLSLVLIIWSLWAASMGIPYLILFKIEKLRNQFSLFTSHTVIRTILVVLVYILICILVLNAVLAIHIKYFGPIDMGSVES